MRCYVRQLRSVLRCGRNGYQPMTMAFLIITVWGIFSYSVITPTTKRTQILDYNWETDNSNNDKEMSPRHLMAEGNQLPAEQADKVDTVHESEEDSQNDEPKDQDNNEENGPEDRRAQAWEEWGRQGRPKHYQGEGWKQDRHQHDFQRYMGYDSNLRDQVENYEHNPDHLPQFQNMDEDGRFNPFPYRRAGGQYHSKGDGDYEHADYYPGHLDPNIRDGFRKNIRGTRNRRNGPRRYPGVEIDQVPEEQGVEDEPVIPDQITYNISGNSNVNSSHQKRNLVIALPTVFRTNSGSQYLETTLHSLLRHIQGQERSQVCILIYAADFDDDYRARVLSTVNSSFKEHVASGFIILAEANKSAYPPLENLKQNYNDPVERVKWRSKQVVDYAFMMNIGRKLGTYYMQIEDDVISSINLYKHILKSIAKYNHRKWVILEFSNLGFIGKLFKSEDLERFVRFLLMFYDEQPVDWLYPYYHKLLTQRDRFVVQPALFQHFGLHSSFSLKTSKALNKLKEMKFAYADTRDLEEVSALTAVKNEKDIAELDVPNVQLEDKAPEQHKAAEPAPTNPPAYIHCSIKGYASNLPQYAYESGGQRFFWAAAPKENDTYSIIFRNPINLTYLHIETGHEEHVKDFAHSAVVEYSTQKVRNREIAGLNFQKLQYLDHGLLTLESINITTPITCLQIRITKKQDEWLIIREIYVNRK